MTQPPVRAMLFDFGNVVIDIDTHRTLRAWAEYSPHTAAEMASLFVADEVYERHERGEIKETEFYAHMRNTLSLETSDDAIIAGWNRLLVEPFDETVQVISKINRRIPCYGLSNTNRTHILEMERRFEAVLGLFAKPYLSADMGMRKPESAIFEAVCAGIGESPENILFFDDSPINIDAAQALGFQSVLVKESADVHRAINGVINIESEA
ncbi:MAG: HAD-IA family hydrolase [Chromatiales bacterium]|nr:HAD-IA family hydrolase [Chromatiales bacterium]